MKKPKLSKRYTKFIVRVCMILCLCMVFGLLSRPSTKATAAGAEGLITINMSDSYGDGWSDNGIEVYADGELLGVATMDDGASGTWTTPIDPHKTYEFRWVSGTYAQETDFVIYMGTVQKIAASGYDYAGGATILSVKESCSGPNYSGGVCADCGAPCTHGRVGGDGSCADCGYTCSGHYWVNGACSVCFGVCLHETYDNGACAVCGAKMVLAIEMEDVYSDGWNNNFIKIYADGVLLDTITIDIGFTGLWTTEYNSNAIYTFEWVKGSYSDECSFRILLMGEACYEAATGECADLAEGVFFTLKPWCAHKEYDSDFCCVDCGTPCAHMGLKPKGTCGDCGFTCGASAPHDWENNICTVCGFSCAHDSWTDNTCDHCGLICGSDVKHSFDANHTCGICGFTCGTTAAHAWEQGVCGVCETICDHSKWTNCVCGNCGMACGSDVPHSFNDNHVCGVCGFACGSTAAHTWNKGMCTTCGVSCEHSRYVNGLCAVCGNYESAVQNGVGENGFALYEIYNAGQLMWFADYVNSNQVLLSKTIQGATADDSFFFEYTTGCVNGKLMADIDMNGLKWMPIGVPYSTHSASRNAYGYAGMFDGNGHTVSGITCIREANENTVYAGFFGALGGGTVQNLTVKGNIRGIVTSDYYPAAYVGGIVGYACEWFDYPGQSEQERQNVNSIIINCTFIGTVSAEAADQEYVGGIVGMASGTSISNCLAAATVSASKIGISSIGSVCGYTINECVIENCWYDSTLCNQGEVNGEDVAGIAGMSTQRWELGFGAQTLGFGQTLGVDIYPSYGDDPVYQATTGCCTYTNTPVGTAVQKAHKGAATCTQDAICEDCGETYSDAENHSYSSKVTTAATCEKDGLKTFTCSRCGDSYTEVIPATGHSYAGGKCGNCGDTKVVSVNGTFNDWAGQNMTWTEKGYTFNIVLSAGTYDFKILKDGVWLGNNGDIENTTVKTSDIGWEFADWGYDCTLIATGGTYTFTFNFDTNMLVIEFVHSHAYAAGEVVAPTCEAEGYTVYTCPCGDSYHSDEKAALGHDHVGEVTTAATCTSDGVKTFTCSRCGDSYTQVIGKLGHDYKAVVTAPTCEAKGYTTHTCSRCADSYKDSYVDALGHNFVDGSCQNCGTGCDHQYTSKVTKDPTCTADGVRTYTCSVCGGSYTEAIDKLGHSYSGKVTVPTCTAEGYTTYTCSTCGDVYTADKVAALGHSYSEEVTDATCEKDGLKTFTCGNCSHSYTEVISATGHSYAGGKCGNCGDTKVVSVNGTFNDWAGQNMTWTEKGYTFNIVLSAGTYDFKVLKDGVWLGNNGDIEDTTTATSDIGWEFADWGDDCTLIATGGTYTFTFNFDTNMLVIEFVHTHAYAAGEVVAPTCEAEGYTVYTCPCGDSYHSDEKVALGHDHVGEVTTDATCTSDGVKTFTCSRCGDSYTQVIGKLGHDYKATVTAPTCEDQGYTTHTCSRCADSYVADRVAALGHKYMTDVVEPGCMTDGYTIHTCDGCGNSYRDTFVYASGHSWQEATCTEAMVCTVCSITRGEALGHVYRTVITAPTCDAAGSTTYTCSVCGDSYSEEIPALGHTWVDADCNTAKTCSVCGATEGEALGHSYEAVVTAPDCVNGGYTTYTCSACGDSYVADETAALGHTMSEATCDEPATCSVCGATEGEALGHSYEAVVTAPTCAAGGYTTYTCSICGDSYVSDQTAALAHEAVTYSFVNNVHTFTCTTCGQVAFTKTATDGKKFNINTAAPVLSDDIVMKYGVTIPAGFENPYMVFDFNGESFLVEEYDIDASNGRYVFKFPGINPQKMGDNICSTLYATVDGYEVSLQFANYSLLAYCDNQLKKSNLSATLRTQLSDVLVYGEKTQLVTGYKTDVLVTTLLSPTSTLTPSTFPDSLDESLNLQKVLGDADARVYYSAVNLSLGSKMAVRLTVVCNDTSLFTYKVNISGREYTYTGEDLVPVDGSSNKYYLYFNQMKATELDQKITFTIWEGDTQISDTIEYSVYTYVLKNYNNSKLDENTRNLLKAIYNYGETTKLK